MARFEETPELFGCETGTSTCDEIRCELCGTVHNEGHRPEDMGGFEHAEDRWVLNTEFAGKTVCECCFERIEDSVVHRMPAILKWYRRMLAARRARLEESEKLLSGVIGGADAVE